MSYQKHSFLMGLSVGRNLKGWSGGAGAAGLMPTCWNDVGVYDRFYIDYGAGLKEFSYGRFCNKTGIFGTAGELAPTDAVQVDGHTVCVYADISAQTRIRLYGNAKAGLPLADGRECPAWAAEFWVDGEAPYELPYGAESLRLSGLEFGGEEGFALAHPACGAWSMAERIILPAAAAVQGGESVSVAYT